MQIVACRWELRRNYFYLTAWRQPNPPYIFRVTPLQFSWKVYWIKMILMSNHPLVCFWSLLSAYASSTKHELSTTSVTMKKNEKKKSHYSPAQVWKASNPTQETFSMHIYNNKIKRHSNPLHMAGYLHGILHVTFWRTETALLTHLMVFYGLFLSSIAMATTRCFRKNCGKW